MSRKTLDYKILIQESAERLEVLINKKSQIVRSKERLHFIWLLKTGQSITQVSAGACIGLKARQSQKLWSLYQKEGLEGLIDNRYKGGNNHRLDSTQDAALLARLDKDDCITQGQIIAYVSQTFQVKYSPSGMSRKLKRLGAKAKTGRPVNVRKDEAGEKAFKKTLPI